MNRKMAILGILVTTLLSSNAFADSGKYQAAMQACAAKLDLTAPVQWKSLDSKSRADLRSCLEGEGVTFHQHHHKFWKKVQACVTQAGVTLPPFQPGSRPVLTDPQKAAIQTCRAQIAAQRKSTSTN